LAFGVVAAVLLTPARRWLLSGWLWASVGLSILIFLPNLVWQAQHHFISREFLSYLHARDLRQGRYDGFFAEQLLVNVNVVAAPLGLWFYFFHREGRRYRLLGWMFVVSFVIFDREGSTGARLRRHDEVRCWRMAWSRETSPRACRSTRPRPRTRRASGFSGPRG
jgi:hypothetical protein